MCTPGIRGRMYAQVTIHIRMKSGKAWYIRSCNTQTSRSFTLPSWRLIFIATPRPPQVEAVRRVKRGLDIHTPNSECIVVHLTAYTSTMLILVSFSRRAYTLSTSLSFKLSLILCSWRYLHRAWAMHLSRPSSFFYFLCFFLIPCHISWIFCSSLCLECVCRYVNIYAVKFP